MGCQAEKEVVNEKKGALLSYPTNTSSSAPLNGTPSRKVKRALGRSFSFTALKAPSVFIPSQAVDTVPTTRTVNIDAHLKSAKESFCRSKRINKPFPTLPLPTKGRPTVIDFLNQTCPLELMPHILAFAGPQTAEALSKVNKTWKNTVDDEETWRIMCEDLYKWQPGQAKPASWKEYYRLNPCVPVDYPSIAAAVASFSAGSPAVRILVRPGAYDISEAIHMDTTSTNITIEKLNLPQNVFVDAQQSSCDSESFSRRFASLDLLNSSKASQSSSTESFIQHDNNHVVLRSSATPTRNEPIFRVSSGNLVLNNIRLQHCCPGTDIWGGNAAIHIEPENDSKVSVVMSGCQVTSASGRGIVVTNGAELEMINCHVHMCAATGVYVGGEHSQANLRQCDVTTNGLGNQQRGGIARGHSGIYLEQGRFTIISSNISLNSASGISVAALPGQRHLKLIKTDLIGNGVQPIDVPFGVQDDDIVYSVINNSTKLGNRMLHYGGCRTRSTLLPSFAPPAVISLTAREEYI